MNIADAVGSVYRNYFNFSGRAGRSEYWWFQLFFLLVYFVGAFAVVALGRSAGSALLTGGFVWLLLTIIPQLAVAVRRLHDSGKSGWWLLIAFIPFGGFVVLILTCLDTQRYPNRWGPPPSYVQPQWPYPPQPGYGYPPVPYANSYPNQSYGNQPQAGYQPAYNPPPPGAPPANPLSENQPPPNQQG